MALTDESFDSALGYYSPKEKVCGSLYMKGTTNTTPHKIEFINLVS
jgi:hypothetical protein